jgi:hypothetical protein
MAAGPPNLKYFKKNFREKEKSLYFILFYFFENGIIEYALVAWLVFYISQHRDDDMLDVKVDSRTLYMDFIAFKPSFFA